MSKAIGSPRSAAKGQLTNVEKAVVKTAISYDFRNQAPWLIIKSSMEVEEGRNDVEDINIPVEKVETNNAICPTFPDAILDTPL